MSHIAKLDKQTEKKLNSIYDNIFLKWRNGLVEKKPTKLGIVRTLINGLYETFVEDGEIEE